MERLLQGWPRREIESEMANVKTLLESPHRTGPVASSSGGATLVVMSDVHQCPFCELRFISLSELQFHIQLDHPDREVPERRH